MITWCPTCNHPHAPDAACRFCRCKPAPVEVVPDGPLCKNGCAERVDTRRAEAAGEGLCLTCWIFARADVDA